MQYRQFGKHGFGISSLGFGCMRFPVIDGDTGKINEVEATRMVRRAIDKGVNYIDTAWPYHNEKSEEVVGRILKDGYRERVYLATKSPVYYVKAQEDYDKYLNQQLEKLQTTHIDMYLLHALNIRFWENCQKTGALDFLKRARDEGKIRYIGFSFHDQLPLYKELLDAFDWDFVQIQLNYMNETYQAGLEGLKLAAERGLPVIIMEPLLGGNLAKPPAPELQKIWDQAENKRTPAQWALRWLWNIPEVTTILSGMSTLEQVEENLNTAHEATVGCLTQQESALIHQAREFLLSRRKVNCTECAYCQPCPVGVRIPRIFSVYNDASMYDDHTYASGAYKNLAKNKGDYSLCTDCAKCEEACPQNLEIRSFLKEFHDRYNA